MRVIISISLFILFVSATAQNLTQFISYEVPIHIKAVADNGGKTIAIKEELTPRELEEQTFYRLEVIPRLTLINTIFSKLRSGEVSAYFYDIYDYKGNTTYETPDKYFKNKIPLKDIDSVLSETTLEAAFDYETGMQLYDSDGNPMFENVITNYTNADVISLTFYEEWTIDDKTNILSKNVKGYSINVAQYDYVGNFSGVKPLCFIPSISFKTKGKMLVKNIETNTTIKQEIMVDYRTQEFIPERWWENCILPEMRFKFLGKNDFAPFASPSIPKEMYDTWLGIDITAEFPFTYKFTKEQAELNSNEKSSVPLFSTETGLPLYDEYNNQIYESELIRYLESEIQHLSFIESWYFDEQTLSIQKKIKGLMPTVNYLDPYTGEVMGIKTLFCIKY